MYSTKIRTNRGRKNPHSVQRKVEQQIRLKSSEEFRSGRRVDSNGPLPEEKKVANCFQYLPECYYWYHKTKYCAEGDRTVRQLIPTKIRREW